MTTSPPAEKTTARQDQGKRQASARDGDGCNRFTAGEINCDGSANASARALPVDEKAISRDESRYGRTRKASGIVFHQTGHRTERIARKYRKYWSVEGVRLVRSA